ncbi:hypothetical protein [Staphylococcus petrasii]|uniref:hypothetical protein n=1 Tax=Staphylococcus petrasii TaxID=1276936 RepID=UPI000CD2D397|nr:hypothetical protein [Staphylococcus petrasii]PNZ79898.1 hypothetical protein CD127_11545 [Staphylococcus petrasii]TGA82839.1 hypothetical protein E2554_04580 [Staphylococcus petrasii]SUM59969.1 Late competence protein ComGE [Staphylococcus petrasii]
MYRFNKRASILADSIFSFLIIVIISTIFIPLLSQLNISLKEQYKYLEMKQAIITCLNHYNTKELSQGIDLGDYHIKLNKDSICNFKNVEKNKVCVKY